MQTPTLSYSQAIALGATLAPQAFGILFDLQGRTCANGAALEAGGFLHLDRDAPLCTFASDRKMWNAAIRQWPILLQKAACPDCDQIAILGDLVAHLNNDHRWTRQRIAEFVAAIETQLQPALDPAPVQIAAEAIFSSSR